MSEIYRFEEFTEALISKKSLDQLKMVKDMSKDSDIGVKIRKDITEPPAIRKDGITDIQTYDEYMKEPFIVNQNIKQIKKEK